MENKKILNTKVYDLWGWRYHQVISQFSNFSSEQFDWLCFMVWASFVTKKCIIVPPFLLHLKSREKEQLMMKRLFSSSVPSLSPAAPQYCSYTVRKISWSYAVLRVILTVMPRAACRDAITQQGCIWFWSGTFTERARQRVKGHWWLIFWKPAACVSNRTFIVFLCHPSNELENP